MFSLVVLICLLLQTNDNYVYIDYKNRVHNFNGIQCVWATVETLGNHVGEKKLFNLTLKQKDYSNKKEINKFLSDLGVHFVSDEKFNTELIEYYLQKDIPCLFNTTYHVATLIQYDEQNNIVKYIDNNDNDLYEKKITISEFKKIWKGWVLVILPSNQ